MDCSLQITADVLPPNALFVQIKLVVFLRVQKQVQQYVEYSV